MRTRIPVAIAAALLGVAALGGIVSATPASARDQHHARDRQPRSDQPQHQERRLEDRDPDQGSEHLTVVENRVAPGGSFGWHSHPGPSLVIVKSGTLTFYEASDPTCTPSVHTVGDAYVDEGTDVHVARNEGTVEAIVIVTRLIPDGAAPRIDEPDPGTAPSEAPFRRAARPRPAARHHLRTGLWSRHATTRLGSAMAA